MAMDENQLAKNIFQQAKLIKDKVSQLKEDAGQRTSTATAGGGMVTVTVNGNNQLLAIGLEKEVVNPDDTEMLADLIIAAANEALNNVNSEYANELTKLTGKINLQDLF